MSRLVAYAGMHAFFGSDAWSSFGVRAVEWATGRILSHLQDTTSVKRNPLEDGGSQKSLDTSDK